ncbi:hypothetical protein HWD96_04570 [Pseudomonas putida]|uniref:hypothetical protein n=1 Tax=Pseudomonas putida TaxID=303 RepID=UPI001F518C83|nr:hypothetical protein [Pseudomonas putida]MCI1021496.1 hypothetical protein [Pseudomonas putida]
MTFRIQPRHDLTHYCPAGHDHPDHPTDLDSGTWTCRTCRQSVWIDLPNPPGPALTVERVPARDVRVGDYLVCRIKAGHETLKVHVSKADRRHAGRWDLRIERHGPLPMAAIQYVNCIRG